MMGEPLEQRGFPPEKGIITLPATPGIGIAIDEDKIERYCKNKRVFRGVGP